MTNSNNNSSQENQSNNGSGDSNDAPDSQPQLEQLLETVGRNMPTASPEFIQQLAEKTAVAFLDCADASEVLTTSAVPKTSPTTSSSAVVTPATPTNHSWNHRMFYVASRALVASLIGFIAWFGWSAVSSAPPTLGAALDKSVQSRSMEIVFRSGEVHQAVWTTPDSVRIELTETHYEIGNQEATWLIDEPKKRVSTQQQSYFGTDGQVDLLSVLSKLVRQQLAQEQLTTLRALKPKEGDFDGVACYIYDTHLDLACGRCQLTAYVESETGLLREFQFRRPTIELGAAPDRLRVLKYDGVIDEQLFVLSPELTPGGQIAKIKQSEGHVWIRPVMRRRWTLASEHMILEVGDQIRSDGRGANAMRFQLAGKGTITVGPKSLVELVSNDCIKLNYGDAELKPQAGETILLAQSNQAGINDSKNNDTIAISEPAVYRRIKPAGDSTGELQKLDSLPVWLTGFDGDGHDPTGSLIATVDGRNVPLTVGYHKVNVDIRDQIARTVIEQSFVNHTSSRLEGVFYFPLPQDASISGFGMWINGELVEADVVEKQRAREIYETILREKRDPGLLEWTGGNIFKARVFPIEANSEKRIKITYTQVLPRRGNRYVYNYGLQSEMLRQNPLRNLDITVKVSSTSPLAGIEVASHETRNSLTANAASVEFSAEEYTPERDFELAVTVDRNAPSVTMIPHERAGDGYFLLQLNPPSGTNGWQQKFDRNLLADGEPLELLIVADTSASMNESARKAQADFVEALIGSLAIKDRVNVSVADVDCQWQFENSVQAGPECADKVHQWLSQRESLGWSNLDRTMSNVLEKATAGTHVVYVGDGMVSTYTADPFAFASRMKNITVKSGVTFHSVSVGSSYESTVLKSLASIGGGSMRRVSADRPAAQVAGELLMQVVSPSISDLKVEFEGVRVAGVYPEVLPNLAVGTQQILLGRYLPTGSDQTGTVTITGKQGGKSLKWSVPIECEEAKSGNSFVPRLWARMHLDSLLAEGSGTDIQKQIIGLSEEFHIITPYTSLLVLESDADRERFGVLKRFQMRDGEQFFADGRDHANFELLQKQMRAAGTWRIGLQRQLLQELAGQGRQKYTIVQAPSYGYDGGAISAWNGRISGSTTGHVQSGEIDKLYSRFARSSFRDGSTSSSRRWNKTSEIQNQLPASPVVKQVFDLNVRSEQRSNMPASELSLRQLGWTFASGDEDWSDVGFERDGRRRGAGQRMSRLDFGFAIKSNSERGQFLPPGYYGSLLPLPGFTSPVAATTLPDNQWNNEVLQLVEQLIQADAYRELDGVLRMSQQTRAFNARTGHTTSLSSQLVLYRPDHWFQHSATAYGSNAPSQAQWNDGQHEFVVTPAKGLGRKRLFEPGDHLLVPQAFLQFSRSLVSPYIGNDWTATIEKNDDGTILKFVNGKHYHYFLIDTKRNVILEANHGSSDKDQPSSIQRYSKHVQVGGIWLPGEVEQVNEFGQTIGVTEIDLRLVDAAEIAKAIAASHRSKETIFVAELTGETAANHRFLPHGDALAGNGATVEDHIYWIQYFMQTQRPKLAARHLAALEKITGRITGWRWLELSVLAQGHRFEELRLKSLELAAELGKEANELSQATRQKGMQAFDVVAAANSLLTVSSQSQVHERLEILEKLKQVYELDQLLPTVTMQTWLSHQASILESIDRQLSLPIWRRLAEEKSFDVHAQTTYARQLSYTSDYDSAIAWIRQTLKTGPKFEWQGKGPQPDDQWSEYETGILQVQLINLLNSAGMHEEVVKYCESLYAKEQFKGCAVYLTSLVSLGEDEKVDATLNRWLQRIRSLPTQQQLDDGAKPANAEPINAALDRIAPRWNYQQAVEKQWLDPLYEVGLVAASDPATFQFTSRILQSQKFMVHDQGVKLRQAVGDYLVKHISTMPHSLILSQLSYAQYSKELNANTQSKPDWTGLIITPLRKRWEQESDENKNEQLAQWLLSTLKTHADPSDVIRFLRERVEQADDENRIARTTALYNWLAEQEWTQELETETWSLLAKMDTPDNRTSQVDRLMSWVDQMVASRVEAELAKIGEPEQVPPQEMKLARIAAQKASRLAIVKHLLQQMDERNANGVHEWFQPWLQLEASYLQAQSGEDKGKIRKALWSLLEDEPLSFIDPDADLESVAISAANAANDADEVKRLRKVQHERAELYQQRMRVQQRALASLMFQLAHKNSKPSEQERLLAFIQKGNLLEHRRDIERWRLAEFCFQLVLGNTQEATETLTTWTRNEDRSHDWRQILALLVAESGDVQTAVDHFEFIEAHGLLEGSDYHRLADWYLVLDRRDDHDRAKRVGFDAIDENSLSNFLHQQRNRSEQTSMLDEDVRFAYASVLRRSRYPSNYTWMLRETYLRTRDFRILAAVPDSVIGHTSLGIYQQLEAWQQLLSQVEHEATVDSILKHVNQLRSDCRTDVDRRALDLIEAAVERRASELENGGAPHLENALARVKSAFAHPWAYGERQLMARYLANWQLVSQPELRREQLRMLSELHQGAMQESDALRDRARLQIAFYWALALRAKTEDRPQAVQRLESALDEYLEEHKLSPTEQHVVHALINDFEYMKRFAAGERRLTSLSSTVPSTSKIGDWLENRLDDLYIKSVRESGTTSLTSGKRQYENVRDRLLTRISDARSDLNRNSRVHALSRFFQNVHEVAKLREIGNQDFKKFAFEEFPKLRFTQRLDKLESVYRLGSQLRVNLGYPTGLEFLVQSLEDYPQALRMSNQGYVSSVIYQLHEFRHHSKALKPEMEQRVLNLLSNHLEHKLRSLDSNFSYFRKDSNSYFWEAKRQDYLRVAKRVWKDRQDSTAHVTFISEYVGQGLQLPDQAVLMLETAYQQEKLADTGTSLLIDMQTKVKGYARAVELLRGRLLTDGHRQDINDHTRLIQNLGSMNDQEGVLEAIAAADKIFNIPKFDEHSLRELATSCVAAKANDYAVGCYNRLIERRRRANPTSDHDLSKYYQGLSLAHQNLGHLVESLDAANAGIVVSDQKQERRAEALERLNQLVQVVADGNSAFKSSLTKLTELVNAEEAKTGLINYLVHKAIAQRHMARNEFAEAIERLELAVTLQPGDREIHQALINCYEKTDQAELAIAQQLRLIRLFPREVGIYQDLSTRYLEQAKPEQSERALTSLVEMLPTETEGHVALAKVRQDQDRWSDAILHWQEVAELRKLEPTGLIGLCEAQLHEQDMPAARKTLKQLRATEWPPRFDEALKSNLKKFNELIH